MSNKELVYFEDTFQYQIDTNVLGVCSVFYDHNGNIMDFDSHVHSYYEIRYSIEGTYTLSIGDRYYDIPPNSLVFIPPLRVHSITQNKAPRLLQVQATQSFLSAAALPGNYGALVPTFSGGYLPVAKQQQKLLQQLIAHSPVSTLDQYDISLQNYSQDQVLMIYGDLYKVIGTMLKERSLCFNNDPVLKNAAVQFSDFQKLIMYILTHPGKEMSLKEAASFTGMSYYYFSKTFHHLMGMPYTDFVNKARVNCAKNMLVQKDMSIKEICSELNIGSTSYFNQLFKKYTGISPSQYRNDQTS